MTAAPASPSPRRAQLLDAAYAYVLEHGLAGMSLRPLAAAVGSSPRVLLYLFGSRDGLVRALLGRAREDEIARLADLVPAPGDEDGLAAAGERLWDWLADGAHRPLLVLWLEAYARSLVEPAGPWAGFARGTVDGWLDVLARAQPAAGRDGPAARTARTAVLAVLRGALLDLLATGDTGRTTGAVRAALATL